MHLSGERARDREYVCACVCECNFFLYLCARKSVGERKRENLLGVIEWARDVWVVAQFLCMW